jgi:energy-coupling factor transport system ATP-binding protein
MMIEVRDFSFSYAGAGDGETALSGISLSIDRGDFVLLCGGSGSGKTTLLRNLKPEIAPAGNRSGEILIDGRKERTMRESAEKIGFVMQDPDNQIVMDSVWLELAFGLENLGVPSEEIGRRIGEIAAFFGIESWFGKSVFELSGGQKQILTLASVIAMQAEIIILDEPTAQLDPIAAKAFLQMLKRVNTELGKTVLLSEHLLEEVLSDCDKVIYLKNGSVDFSGDRRSFALHIAENDPNFIPALPAAARLFLRYRAQRGATSETESTRRFSAVRDSANEGGSAVPLDVKEGRRWLAKLPFGIRGGTMLAQPSDPEKVRAGSLRAARSYAIEAKDVWFRYDKQDEFVLQGLDTRIEEGRIHVFVGGNGCGKSTLLSVLGGLYKPFRGKVATAKDKRVAMLVQDPKAVFVCDAVKDDLREHSGAITEEEALAMAEKLGLTHLLQRHPYDLSAGEMQKAALAKILLLRPDVLLLDEPIKGLDAFARREIGEILTELRSEGVTIAMVTHDVEFAATYADTCSMLFGKAIIAGGAGKEFFGGNMFYTTGISRMTRGVADGCVLEEDVIFNRTTTATGD